mmetsp:Transcript_9482/g.32734  ORF Transcript_9482/g.32734 Transcript_9482/m.32734 type:complete len:215 (+) Transcript_9482:467-1111(+)
MGAEASSAACLRWYGAPKLWSCTGSSPASSSPRRRSTPGRRIMRSTPRATGARFFGRAETTRTRPSLWTPTAAASTSATPTARARTSPPTTPRRRARLYRFSPQTAAGPRRQSRACRCRRAQSSASAAAAAAKTKSSSSSPPRPTACRPLRRRAAEGLKRRQRRCTQSNRSTAKARAAPSTSSPSSPCTLSATTTAKRKRSSRTTISSRCSPAP